jgi:hypothetical protein
MLLTFLGLTLAATTSTELQIATNYRWSQQALYNAEAGLEAAKVILAQVSAASVDWSVVQPTARTVPWNYGAATPPVDPARAGLRDYERSAYSAPASPCPSGGDRGGIGYGRILTGPPFPGGPTYQDVSNFMGSALNGAFTLWVRRDLLVSPTGQFSDNTDPAAIVVTSEGVAPYTGTQADAQVAAFTRANQARRILEVRYALLVNQGNRCQSLSGQEGLAPSGENFDPCSPLKSGGVAKAFGGGSLVETGAK